MARKKETPKPLFAVKHDFVDSLDNFIQKSINLSQIARTVLELKAVDARIADKLKTAVDEFDASMMTED